MCKVCKKCRELPLDQALTYIAEVMSLEKHCKCLDDLIGELVGVKEKERDLELEERWELERVAK